MATAVRSDETPALLERGTLFPLVGPPIYVNRPLHQGDTPLHQHDFIELALVASGHALHRTIRGLAPVSAGDVLVLRPGDWHAYERAVDLRLANCNFAADLLHGPLAWLADDPAQAQLLGLDPARSIDSVHLAPESLARCVAAADELRRRQLDNPERHRLELVGLLLVVLGEIGQGAGAVLARARSAAHPAVAQAIALMTGDLARPWSLEGLADRFGLDRAYFVRLFRRRTGLPPMAWLARARGERAAVLLLTTGKTIAEIGRDVGWDDPNYCARRFRALFRQTPSAYRAQLPCAPRAVAADEWIQW